MKVQKRANGKYRVQYYMYTDKQGKQHIGSKTFDNEMDAELFIQEVYKERKMRKRQEVIFSESYAETVRSLNEQANARRDENRPKPVLPRSEMKEISVDLPQEIEKELESIDKMSGQDFEKYIMNLLKLTGLFYGADIKDTDTIKDFGVDIVLETINGVKVGIQCKRLGSNVKVDAIQEVFSGLPYYKAQYGAVVTNAYFTPSAIKLARSTGIYLIDRIKLGNLIQYEKERTDKLMHGNQWLDFIDFVDTETLKV